MWFRLIENSHRPYWPTKLPFNRLTCWHHGIHVARADEIRHHQWIYRCLQLWDDDVRGSQSSISTLILSPITKLPKIFSGVPPFYDTFCYSSSLREEVVDFAKRPPKPEWTSDIDSIKLWDLIEDCWSQESLKRPTAATVSSRLGDLSHYVMTDRDIMKYRRDDTRYSYRSNNENQLDHFSLGLKNCREHCSSLWNPSLDRQT